MSEIWDAFSNIIRGTYVIWLVQIIELFAYKPTTREIWTIYKGFFTAEIREF